MKVLLKIDQVPDFFKDADSGAVVNTNDAALRSYRARRRTNFELNDTKAKLVEIESGLNALRELIADMQKKA
ncbi:MAG: hypothetical protein DDT26_01710 [Dehalococcoidia bacterium]|nr:hypothetical protein [Chloroflexota bacterium]